jgi:hypothetical protein
MQTTIPAQKDFQKSNKLEAEWLKKPHPHFSTFANHTSRCSTQRLAKELAYPNARQTETLKQIDRKMKENKERQAVTRVIANAKNQDNADVLS